MAAVSALAGDASCLRAAKPLAAGVVAAREAFEPAACEGAARAFRYDQRAKVARAVRDIVPGEVLEPLPGFALPAVSPGDPLRLHAAVGPVTVERAVVAVQAAEPGERLFVRTADGSVFAIQLSEAQP